MGVKRAAIISAKSLLGGETPKTIEMQSDKLGKTKNGLEVEAATDACGPQVIVTGPKTHLLSKPLKDHAAAIKLGKEVVKKGTKIYQGWFDLKKGGLGTALFAIWGGEYRGGSFQH